MRKFDLRGQSMIQVKMTPEEWAEFKDTVIEIDGEEANTLYIANYFDPYLSVKIEMILCTEVEEGVVDPWAIYHSALNLMTVSSDLMNNWIIAPNAHESWEDWGINNQTFLELGKKWKEELKSL